MNGSRTVRFQRPRSADYGGFSGNRSRSGSGTAVCKVTANIPNMKVIEMADWSKRYPYNESNVRKFAPTTGGVYRLIYKKGEKYIVFYVGQSEKS